MTKKILYITLFILLSSFVNALYTDFTPVSSNLGSGTSSTHTVYGWDDISSQTLNNTNPSSVATESDSPSNVGGWWDSVSGGNYWYNKTSGYMEMPGTSEGGYFKINQTCTDCILCFTIDHRASASCASDRFLIYTDLGSDTNNARADFTCTADDSSHIEFWYGGATSIDVVALQAKEYRGCIWENVTTGTTHYSWWEIGNKAASFTQGSGGTDRPFSANDYIVFKSHNLGTAKFRNISYWDYGTHGLSGDKTGTSIFAPVPVDTSPPTFSLNNTNSSNILINDDVQFSITITDDNPDKMKFFWNQSGTFVNDTALSYTSGISVSTTKTITSNKGSNICWGYWANDTGGYTNTSFLSCFVVGNNPPNTPIIYTPTQNAINTSIIINFTATDINPQDLLTYRYYINGTLNGTTNLTNPWIASDGVYALIAEANDGTASTNSSIVNFEIDTTPPGFKDFTISGSLFLGSSLTFGVTAKDPNLNSNGLFFWNMTGTFTNFSFGGWDGNNAGTITKTIANNGNRYDICYGWWAEDTLDNSNSSRLLCFNASNTPPTVNIISPVNGTINRTNTIPILFSGTDTDPWTTNLTYDLFVNGLINMSSLTNNITSWNASDGNYTIVMRAYDGENYTNSSPINFILDASTPQIILNPNNAFNSSNQSNINQYMGYLSLDYQLLDNRELFAHSINITSANNTNYYSDGNASLAGYTSINITKNISVSDWADGLYIINISTSDPHTALEIDDYDVSKFFGSLTFNTAEGNRIKVSGNGAYSTSYVKKRAAYNYELNYLLQNTKRTFYVESNNPIHYMSKSKYKGHLVILSDDGINGNWIDFEGTDGKVTIEFITPYKVKVTINEMSSSKKVKLKSIGGLNTASNIYYWYKGSVNTTQNRVVSSQTNTIQIAVSKEDGYISDANAILRYNNTIINGLTKTVYANNITLSKELAAPAVTINTEVPLSWEVEVEPANAANYSFIVNRTQEVLYWNFDNCSTFNHTVLVIHGKNEETNKPENLSLDITMEAINGLNSTIALTLSGRNNYSFCSNNETNFSINAIMEYDGVGFTHRTYYLNNFSIDTNRISDVFLYQLNNTKASEIVMTVYDSTQGIIVPDVYIKTLRYYPGENILKVVQISKTDERGKTLGKMILADVFYKFILEKPPGTIKENTNVQTILSLTKDFGVSFTEDELNTWNKIHDTNTLVSCTKSTSTCRLEWSDTSNTVDKVTLEVWRSDGITNTLLSSQDVEAAAGTVSYTVTEATDGNKYFAKGYIKVGDTVGNAGTSDMKFVDNIFTKTESDKLASLFPLFMLMVVIIFALIDFGVIGITVGALGGMVLGSFIGILPLSSAYLTSFILMGLILIYKLSR